MSDMTNGRPRDVDGTHPLLKWTISNQNGVSTVALKGEMDLSSSTQLESALLEALQQAPIVVFNLEGLEFIDAAGLRLLIGCRDRLMKSGGRMFLARTPKCAQRLFEIVGVTDSFDYLIPTLSDFRSRGESVSIPRRTSQKNLTITDREQRSLPEFVPAAALPHEDAMHFAQICRDLFEAPTVLETLRMIVNIATATVEGCDGAGISFIKGDLVVTPAWTSQKVLDIDNMQYASGQGPCLDAIADEDYCYAEDLLTDSRWPIFGPQAAAAGMRSLFSCRLLGNTTLGALNMYSASPNAYSESARSLAVVLATHAGIALGSAGALRASSDALAVETKRAGNLHGALASREIIGQAEGVLMNSELITPDEAFIHLRTASQTLNIKLRDVAQYVVDTGELPQGPASSLPQPGKETTDGS